MIINKDKIIKVDRYDNVHFRYKHDQQKHKWFDRKINGYVNGLQDSNETYIKNICVKIMYNTNETYYITINDINKSNRIIFEINKYIKNSTTDFIDTDDIENIVKKYDSTVQNMIELTI